VLSFRPFAPEDADLENFQIITRGLKERRELRFLYRNLGADKAHWRQVRPYHLACVDNHWYLFAFDVKRDAMRTFALIQPARPESCLLACGGPEAGREARPLIIIDFLRAAARSCRQRGGLKMLGRFQEVTQKWRQGFGPVASEEDCRGYGASI
jgi:hypothetical protein